MNDTPSPVHRLLKSVSSATNNVANVDNDNADELHNILNNIAITLSETRDDITTTDGDVIHTYLVEIESFARQIVIHGDPALGEYTVPSLLRTTETNIVEYYNGDATSEDLTDHADTVRDAILENRPETNVIEEYDLEEAFSKSVRNALAKRRNRHE